MGSSTAASSIDRVLSKHVKEIHDGQLAQLKKDSKGLIVDIVLNNEIYKISVEALLSNGGRLRMQPLSLDELADLYPDCHVGY